MPELLSSKASVIPCLQPIVIVKAFLQREGCEYRSQNKE